MRARAFAAWWFTNRGNHQVTHLKATIDAALKDVRTLDFEIDRALHSWSIFHESVRKFEDEQSGLVETINALEIGRTFNHIQMILLHDCVSTICRVTDQNKPGRITLDSVAADLRALFAATESAKVKEFDATRKSLLKSASLADLRTFRNNQLGHTLRHQTPQTVYAPIPVLINTISDLLSEAFFLFGYPRWIGQPTINSFEGSAIRFWDRVEIGLKN